MKKTYLFTLDVTRVITYEAEASFEDEEQAHRYGESLWSEDMTEVDEQTTDTNLTIRLVSVGNTVGKKKKKKKEK